MTRRLYLQPTVWAGASAAILIVVAGCSTFNAMRGNNQYGADQHMRDQVRDSLKKDPLYKFPNVAVNVYRDQVQLSGVVNLPAQKTAAVKDASRVSGVLGVKDNIMVNTNPPVAPE
ncbi:MAG: BON domain-containing protein [Limisphaerales bacterium]